MDIKKTTKIKDNYQIECPRCKKVIEGVSVKQVRHNYKMHELFCKGKTNEKKKD